MKQLILFCSILLVSCNSNEDSPSKGFNEKIVQFAIENSNDKFIELPTLYDSLSGIPNDENERLILVQILKKKGYRIVNWGRGNHLHGPRIVSFNLKKGSCECQVDKIYYSNNQVDSVFEITERIKCNTISR